MAVLYKHPRGTRASLNALASANNLIVGQAYFLTDESRLAVADTVSTFTTFAKEGEGGGESGNGTAWGPVAATGTGAPQNITLPEAVTVDDVLVFVAGVYQPTSNYSINGTTLTTTQPNGLPITIVRYGIGQQGVAGLQSAITEINIDGGSPSTNYGGLTAINGGQP